MNKNEKRTKNSYLFVNKTDSCLLGINIRNPIINVKHQELNRTGENLYESVCPVCKAGILLIKQNRSSLRFSRHDSCILCGQRVYYTDLEYLEEPSEEKYPHN